MDASRPFSRLSKADQQRVIALCDDIWTMYPNRDLPHLYIPFRTEIVRLLQEGVPAMALYTAAVQYADHVVKEGTEKKYVKSLHRFYADGMWASFQKVLVHGRTREEWARSGQDVAEFDRLAHQQQTEAET